MLKTGMIGVLGRRHSDALHLHVRTFYYDGQILCQNVLSSAPTSKQTRTSKRRVVAVTSLQSGRRYKSGRLVSELSEDELLQTEKLEDVEHRAAPPEIDFHKAEIIFKQKSTLELARSFGVLQMCSYNFFVDNSMKLMTLGLRVMGDTLFSSLMRASFYGQFAASPQSVTQVSKKFNAAAIAPMLATTAEEEVGDNPQRINEEKYEKNVETMILCLDMQAEVARPNQPILSQLKMTSYIKADVLAKISDVLVNLNYNFLTENPVSVANFRNGLDGDLKDIPELTDVELTHLKLSLKRLDTIHQRAVKNKIKILVDAEYVSINQAMSLITFALMKKYNVKEPLVWNTYQCYLKDALVNLKRGVGVADEEGFPFGVKTVRGAYMDHERATAKLEAKPGCPGESEEELGVADEEGFAFGVMTVRGAYMDHERATARIEARTDPVNGTFEDTNNMYDTVVAHLMDLVRQRGSNSINLIVATHNTESVNKAIRRMWELGIPPREGGVVFGQLMGMCDHVSYGLGQAGYLTYKSIPFGTMEDVLPNMSRRAVENKTVFYRLKQEKKMLRQEISRRILFSR